MGTITLPAEMAQLEKLILFITSHVNDAGYASRRVSEIELAAEEALVNIFHYAYPGGTGLVRMSCDMTGTDAFQLEISDDGIPFNALNLPDPDISADLFNRKTGGLGVFFMKKMADDYRYRREDGSNVLTLTFQKAPKG